MTVFVIIIISLVALALFRICYLMGKVSGATEQMVELTGSSMPKPKNIPPTPPKK